MKEISIDAKEAKSSISERICFKNSGTVDVVPFISLSRQVESGQKKRDSDLDIIDAVIRAMPPTSRVTL